MELGCTFGPRVDTPDHFVIAEELGYDLAYVGDSPVLWADPWMALGRAAERTSRIRVGIMVTTPRMRHLVATASAIATLSSLAPGRVDVTIGSGYTSQAMIGEKPLRWADVEQYVAALKTLLAGGEVEWNGCVIALTYSSLTGLQLPVRVPIMVAAHGPKALAVADRVAEGIVTNPMHGTDNAPSWSHSRVLVQVNGTVLDDGESYDSERVIAVAGPAAALHLHLGENGAAAGTPELAGYSARLAEIDEPHRHIEMHRGHFMEVTELERPFITADLIRRATDTGSREQVRARIAELAANGVTGVIIPPGGVDIRRELTAFAECVRG